MLLALAGLKGGTGRTTLAVALAAEARARGRRTLLVDLDPRGDAHAWSLSANSSAPTTLRLPGASPGQAERLRGLAFGHDLTVIDTPSDPEVLGVVAEIAELMLVPCRPSPMDAWAAVDTVETCLRSRSPHNFRMQIAVVPNAVELRSTIGAALPHDLRALGLPVLECAVARRVAHQEAMAHGSTASLDAPASAAARDINELLDAIEALQARYGDIRHLHH
ncbi:AAA family ATPase [Enhygromyxa salina]|uniref:nucleotide-binding protein n=1 Tax=Enhygromyxa salina TaxID=215803 RepID=UPI0006962417|nr:AAA family ATPase [Enhygromyxa salina]